jgi:hypothetical protein
MTDLFESLDSLVGSDVQKVEPELEIIATETTIPSQMPWEGMTYNEKLSKTTSVPITTHVLIEGEVCAVSRLEKRYGITIDQWRARQVKKARQTWCVLAGVAKTQDEFLAEHPNTELGYN